MKWTTDQCCPAFVSAGDIRLWKNVILAKNLNEIYTCTSFNLATSCDLVYTAHEKLKKETTATIVTIIIKQIIIMIVIITTMI